MSLHCPSLQQRPLAVGLGKVFARNFATRTAGIGKGEIVLFHALQDTLLALAHPPDVLVEEYHGSDHQVTFTGRGTYSRSSARCELSDLLVIVHDRSTQDARLTYIQAKSERSVPATKHGIARRSLRANLEQWDLLARRPRIGGVGSFAPPPDLLSSAALASVGTFAFFLHGAKGVDIYYAAASLLHRPSHCTSRYGRLIAADDQCKCVPSPECLSVYGNEAFGAFLLGLMIGTPILSRGKPTMPSVCSWLAAQLRGLAAAPVTFDQRVANGLADLLGPDSKVVAKVPNVGATSLLIVSVNGASTGGD